MRMINRFIDRIRRTILWGKAWRAFRDERMGEAIRYIKRMEEIAPLRPYHIALLAAAHVLARDSLKARKEFLRAEQLSRGSNDPNNRYVNAYARVYLTLIDTQDPIDDLLLEATSINCDSPIKRWLPLEPRPAAHRWGAAPSTPGTRD